MRQWTGHGVSKVGVTLKGTPPWAPSSDGGGAVSAITAQNRGPGWKRNQSRTTPGLVLFSACGRITGRPLFGGFWVSESDMRF